jgi:hypothetical protein
MSWVTRKHIRVLEKAVDEAKEENILFFCSTADIGLVSVKVWPADFPPCISVAASDANGRPRPQSREEVDLLVSGQDIMADGPDYIRKQTKQPVSGSSVATALAAGIASLILYISQIVTEDVGWKKFLKKRGILKVFDTMRDGKTKSLQPAMLFRKGFDLTSEGLEDTETWKRMLQKLAYEELDEDTSE